MHGLIWAAVELNMPFALAKSFAVSETATRSREGWSHVDAMDVQDVCAYKGSHPPLPVVLHYCKRYMLGEVRNGTIHGNNVHAPDY
jgi:chorismate mutase